MLFLLCRGDGVIILTTGEDSVAGTDRFAAMLQLVVDAVSATDAGADLILPTLRELVDEFGFDEQRVTDGDELTGAVLKRFFRCYRVLGMTAADERDRLLMTGRRKKTVLQHLAKWHSHVVFIAGLRTLVLSGLAGPFTGEDFDGVDSGFLELLGVVDAVRDGDASVDTLLDDGQLHDNREVVAAEFLDALDDVQMEAAAVRAASAVFILPDVRGRGQELLTEVIADAVDLDTVKACFLRAKGGLSVLLFNGVDFVDGEFPGRLVAQTHHIRIRHGDRTRADRLIANDGPARTTTGVRDLQERLRTPVVDGCRQVRHAGNVLVIVDNQHALGVQTERSVDTCDFYNNSAHAALCARRVMVDGRLVYESVVRLAHAHSRHNGPVADLHVSDLCRGQQSRVFSLCHNDAPFPQNQIYASFIIRFGQVEVNVGIV